jgi:DHA1 family bicyclomycin/chloramphenicol resistance-like MFS transporter
MITRWGVQRSVMLAAVLSLAGGCSMAALALGNWHSGWAVMLPMSAFILGHGIHQPCGQSGAVGPFPQAAGTASAMSGFMMMLAAFAMGQWLGTHMDGTVIPLAFGMCFWGAMVALSAWTLVRRYGHG